jgi:hypothetical protein
VAYRSCRSVRVNKMNQWRTVRVGVCGLMRGLFFLWIRFNTFKTDIQADNNCHVINIIIIILLLVLFLAIMWDYWPLPRPLQTSLSTKLSKLCTRTQIQRHTEKLYFHKKDQNIMFFRAMKAVFCPYGAERRDVKRCSRLYT